MNGTGDRQTVSSDLTGKVYVVTGANSGIGYQAALAFARRGATVALVSRNRVLGERALAGIGRATGNDGLRLFIADFASLASVRGLAGELLAAYPAIDALCNNAGGVNGSRVVTAEGFETTFVTNHLSGYLLTRLLLPALLRAAQSAPARVVFTSSLGHKNSPLDFDDLNLERGYGTMKAYGRSKLMNLLTARELHRRYGAENIVASSFHPGAVRTSIWYKGPFLGKLLGLALYPLMWSVEKGSDTFIWLASSDVGEALHADGNYFFDRRKPRVAAFATDEAAARLWRVSEELVRPWLDGRPQPR